MKSSVIKTPKGFVRWMSGCKDVFSLDCETTSLNYLDLELIGLSLCDGVQACYVYTPKVHKEKILCTLDFYIQEAKLIIMHSAPFDMLVLKKEGIEI